MLSATVVINALTVKMSANIWIQHFKVLESHSIETLVSIKYKYT